MTDRDPYRDRAAAGRELAHVVHGVIDTRDRVVLALPRGGVPVAIPVAELLAAPWDIIGVRKVPVPGETERAMGAVAGLGNAVTVSRHRGVLASTPVDDQQFERVAREQAEVMNRTLREWRGDLPARQVDGVSVVLVDDGLATGSTMLAAVHAVRAAGALQVVVAAPVGAPAACAALARQADIVVCPWQPGRFVSVSQGYRDFAQVDTEYVLDELRRR